MNKILDKLYMYPFCSMASQQSFASQDLMDWTRIQPNVDFITGLTGNVKLHELAQVTIESAQREFN